MTSAPYDAIAAWYDAAVREGSLYQDVILPGMLALLPDLQNLHVCDIACGQGLMARELARRGAGVIGVDIADRLLDLARRYEEAEPLGIRYLHGDAQSLADLPEAGFDGATCNMALMNIPDISAAFLAVHRVLKPGGWFTFSITHPCFQSPHARWVEQANGMVTREVREYFTEGLWFSDNPDGVRGKVGDEHRTLSTYINTLIQTGFTIERLLEPPSTGKRAQEVPGERSIPSILLMRARTL